MFAKKHKKLWRSPCTRKNLRHLYNILGETYGPQKCFLEFHNPFELLIMAILSAQCTDKIVNAVSPLLFRYYPDPEKLAGAKINDIEKIIRTIGLYHAKSKNIILSSQLLCENYKGEVPRDMDSLISLPGVGRKTANVLLGNAFNIPAFPVDTHVNRVLNRLGAVDTKNPLKIELLINKCLKPELLTEFSHLLISHGRKRCKARKPDCENCETRRLCEMKI